MKKNIAFIIAACLIAMPKNTFASADYSSDCTKLTTGEINCNINVKVTQGEKLDNIKLTFRASNAKINSIEGVSDFTKDVSQSKIDSNKTSATLVTKYKSGSYIGTGNEIAIGSFSYRPDENKSCLVQYSTEGGQMVSINENGILIEEPPIDPEPIEPDPNNGGNIDPVNPDDKPKEEPKYTCRHKNGKYYDSIGNEVTESEYHISCDSCYAENNIYYNNGVEVSKEQYDMSCSNKKCIIENDTYYGPNGEIVTRAEYNKSIKNGGCSTGNAVPYMAIAIIGSILVLGTVVIKKRNKLFKI